MKIKNSVIGVFGGSGFYDLLENPKYVDVKTKWGSPSDKIRIGEYAGQKIAFLARHGQKHHLPPHKIPYLANIAAFKKIGVKQIIAPCAVGSLQPNIKPGEFVILDQFVDRTNCRPDTFYNGPITAHITGAEPYCSNLRQTAIDACKKLRIAHHKTGTAVVIQGPRFSTKAESIYYSKQNWEVINMTQYPEVILAREMEICYTGIALVTDYDAGLINNPKIKPVTMDEVTNVFNSNNKTIKKVIFEMIKNISDSKDCDCQSALKNAIL
ncbi:MAG: S-methyl-5'-thioadenosine phosphorylase [Candidatus Portnoybacteria bacterium CG10_big_fil_rev_8_21_14_0_10_36_7]|uniref:S-methyl-5'-thioadenosine phosphorylase n=1 Tax=Candidatus Portnoybacteria bacterium CG10_big_fil_rev_8_21_14_0_10_36_7 TaxID=1974812 RepID=A0A2M8KF40_9BACT|nr:MAG: S-methyl-5'-thioadenosine phosphorylase [Candidatus Portnoybacteria bacterium CG10_big_fil_rev_8_21_14_0_10_36_7]